MTPDLKVVDHPAGNLSDVPKLLRKLADDIESGRLGEVHSAGVVLEAVDCPVYGFGVTGHAQNISELFSIAHQKLSMQRLQNMSED